MRPRDPARLGRLLPQPGPCPSRSGTCPTAKREWTSTASQAWRSEFVTSGVVSRIEVGEYTYSGSSFLLLQVDSPINPGNSGGPAVIDGKLAGISMQTLKDAQNINYLVPTPVIRHFLDDVKDGRFDGFPELGIQVQLLENEAIRKRLRTRGASPGEPS